MFQQKKYSPWHQDDEEGHVQNVKYGAKQVSKIYDLCIKVYKNMWMSDLEYMLIKRKK